MSYKFYFVTKKIYNDNTEKIVIKNGYLPNVRKAQFTKYIKSKIKEMEYATIFPAMQIHIDDYEKAEKRKKELDRKYSPKIENAIRSMNRAKNNLMDIFKSNDFDYFVVLTFDDKKVTNAKNEKETRALFRKWRRYTKDHFPNMTYVAIEEYQDKNGRGVLHYHLLVGNVTAEQLGLVYWRKSRTGRTKGQPVYNVTGWKYGLSTATEILDKAAAKNYVAKYLTKGKIDPRFYGKKRYFTSQNISRPIIEKSKHEITKDFDIFDSINKADYNIDYEDTKKEYIVLSRQLQ